MNHTDQLSLALKNRDRGIERTAAANATFLETMRSVARMIARKQGTVTADDLREWAAAHPSEVEKPTSQNAWGAIFKGKEFEVVDMVMSRQVQGRGNRIFRWKLRA